jgi:hypothetical protein
VPERAEEIFRRAQAAAGPDGRLAPPPLHEWDTFPFEGEIRVRALEPPVETEPPRLGESGPDECWRCEKGDTGVLWSDEHWRLIAFDKPSGIPVIVILEAREHLDLGDLGQERAAELGRLIVRIERAVMGLGEIGRVHVGRWGDGSAHLHVWFMGRPSRLPQLRTSFVAIWDDILPPTPEDVWRRDLAAVARAVGADGGTVHV